MATPTRSGGPERLVPDLIDSPQNRQVAAARALLTRKGRASASAFLVEGPHAAAEAFAGPGHRVRELFVTEAAADREPALMRTAAADGVPVRTVSDRVLASLRDTVTPQGVVAVVDIPTASLSEVLAARPRLLIALERVGDPGNAGTVIRTADAAGADAVVLTRGAVDVWSGKCVRSTAGSVFHLPLVTDADAPTVIAESSAGGLTVLATAADGEADLDDLIDDGSLQRPTLWVFGNEAQGIDAATRATAHRTVRLPVYGRAESLNLAAAAAICLYASARAQRHS